MLVVIAKIGSASCRERVEISVVAVSLLNRIQDIQKTFPTPVLEFSHHLNEDLPDGVGMGLGRCLCDRSYRYAPAGLVSGRPRPGLARSQRGYAPGRSGRLG